MRVGGISQKSLLKWMALFQSIFASEQDCFSRAGRTGQVFAREWEELVRGIFKSGCDLSGVQGIIRVRMQPA